jgi:MYXO-CTERM domain-containing protein
MVWNDEFDGASVDTSKWNFWLSGQTRRAAVNDPANTFLGNGALTVRITNAGGKLTAGGLQSKQGFGYGYYEIRAQVKGGWATFWLQSPGIDGVGDPNQYGTEMDIQEACCPGAVQHAVHWDGYGADHKYQTHGIAGSIVSNQQDWNVYGLEWTADEYKFWVNGQLSWTFTTAVSNRSDEWLRLTEETDGDYCGGECLYIVDYVRVYQNTGAAPEGGAGGATGAGGAVGAGGSAAAGGSKGTGGKATGVGGAAREAGTGGAAGVAGAVEALVDESTEAAPGCGCRTGGRTPGGALWLLGGLGLARRRRRGA